MHVPDGFLSPQITLPAFGAAAPLWAWAARRHFARTPAEALPVMGSLTALAFVVQGLAFPVPGGTTAHVSGATLLALLFHPLLAFACESLVLLLQALLLGAGGITTLGVNALALGLAGPAAGWLAYRALRRRHERAAAFAAAWIATQVSALCVAGVLGLQHALSARHFPVPFPAALAATLLPSLLVTGPLEGAYTLVTLAVLRKARLHELA